MTGTGDENKIFVISDGTDISKIEKQAQILGFEPIFSEPQKTRPMSHAFAGRLALQHEIDRPIIMESDVLFVPDGYSRFTQINEKLKSGILFASLISGQYFYVGDGLSKLITAGVGSHCYSIDRSSLDELIKNYESIDNLDSWFTWRQTFTCYVTTPECVEKNVEKT
jgi:hypothetical protein